MKPLSVCDSTSSERAFCFMFWHWHLDYENPSSDALLKEQLCVTLCANTDSELTARSKHKRQEGRSALCPFKCDERERAGFMQVADWSLFLFHVFPWPSPFLAQNKSWVSLHSHLPFETHYNSRDLATSSLCPAQTQHLDLSAKKLWILENKRPHKTKRWCSRSCDSTHHFPLCVLLPVTSRDSTHHFPLCDCYLLHHVALLILALCLIRICSSSLQFTNSTLKSVVN